MATRTTRSQTRALGTEPPPSPRDNPLSVFGSNRRVSKVIEQFQSFSARRTAPSASSVRFPTESPTPGARIVIPDDDQSDASSRLFGGAVVYNNPGHPNIPGGDPPGPPPDDDDSDFPGHNLTPDDDSDDEPDVEHVPSDALTQLVSAIQSLARSSCCRPPSDSTPHNGFHPSLLLRSCCSGPLRPQKRQITLSLR